ncbi:MAG: glycerol-3-phosphate dehydrogenase, partial [Oscillospiraceae bacterium]|nr:glycerol-3-phosphate dehydrogenase [Oscillospiraceae bacterium]
ILIGQGMPIQQALKEIGAVVEGYYAAFTAHQLSQKIGVEMPICECAYRILYENQSVESVVEQLMTRSKRREVDETWI